MKKSAIFWGTFFITLGILLLGRQFDWFYFSIGDAIRFWPIILIIWGVSLLKMPAQVKAALSGLSAILLAVFIVGAINKACDTDFDCDFYWKRHCIVSERGAKVIVGGAYDTANLQFKAGAGAFYISGPTDKLIESRGYGNVGFLDGDTASGKANLFYKANSIDIFEIGEYDREADIRMNGDAVWNLDISIGAADFEADLRDYKVKDIALSASASDVDLILGEGCDSMHVRIDSRAASIDILAPEGAYCEISSDNSLSSLDLDGFEETGYNTYKSNKNSNKKIFLEINGLASGIQVGRY